ncbi:MAG: hypothetical protein AABZ70_12920, partial [candidate division NC10 bacterium]
LAAASSIGAGSTYTQSGGTLQGAGTLTVNGAFNWSGGSMSGGAAQTVVASGATLNITGAVSLSRRIDNFGTTTWTGTGNISTSGGGSSVVFDNKTGGQFLIQNDQSIVGDGSVAEVVVNSGTITKSVATGTTTIGTSAVTFTNNAAAVVDVQTGTLAIAGGGSSSGNFNMAAGAFLNFTGAYTLNAGASITGAGSARLVGTPTLTVGGNASVQNLLVPTGTVVTGAGDLTVNGTLTWSGGSMSTNTAKTIVASGGVIDVTGTASLGRRIEVQSGGVMRLTGAGQVNTSGGGSQVVLDNLAGGLVDIQNNNGFTGDGSVAETIVNAGTFRKSAGGGTSTISGVVDFSNTGGTLDIQSGQLTLANAFNHTGTGSVLAGVINNGGGGSSSGSLALSSGTQVNITGGTQSLAAGTSLTGAGRYRVNGGILTINGAVGADNLDVLAGTLNGSGTLTINSSMIWSGGAQSDTSGTTAIAAGKTLDITGAVSLGRRIDNFGTTTWTGTGNIS